MSTHYIEEAERLADDVAVMAHGAVVARGTPEALRVKHAGDQATEYYGSPERLAATRDAQTAGLADPADRAQCRVLRPRGCTADVLDELDDAWSVTATLEDVFVLLTGEVLDEWPPSRRPAPRRATRPIRARPPSSASGPAVHALQAATG